MESEPAAAPAIPASTPVDPAESSRSILLLSGPNLNLLGDRQPEVYGTATLADHVATASERASLAGVVVEHLQSNSESDLVAAVHRGRGVVDAIVVNAGAVTHYGWSLHDALSAFDGPVVELHISNPASRERSRHTSVVSPVADVVIQGAGGLGYRLAIDAALGLLGLDLP